AGSGLTGTFADPAQDSYLNQAGWADPSGGDPNVLAFGNAPRLDASVRGFRYFNEDFSIFKDTHFGEGRYVRFQADAGNIFNRVFFCPVDQSCQPNKAHRTAGNSNFGQTGSQRNSPRR